ncbi:MAG: efflux RND transporter periplasmic adaptor subunit [Dongiaceae bacterium]
MTAAGLPEAPPGRRRGLGLAAAALLAAALGAGIWYGIGERAAGEAELAQATVAAAVPTVAVVLPKEGAPAEEIRLPGDVQAFTATHIYARTNGYLQSWTHDIGTHVKQGDLLAVIAAPEVDQQLLQAQADLQTAIANMKLAEITATRDETLAKTGYLSAQLRDNAAASYEAAKATVESHQANVARLQELQSFEKVYAPFDGVITQRKTDVGALINAGDNGSSRELFHLSAIDRLRVYVALPETYSRAVRIGMPASIKLDEYPDRVFHGTVARTANAIDSTTRTLKVEVDVDNPDGTLLPGAYAFVHLSLPRQVRSVTVPVNTLLFRKEGLRVAVVRDGKAELVPIAIGRDYGSAVEVVSGLTPADQVILDPSDSLVGGTPVRVAAPAP